MNKKFIILIIIVLLIIAGGLFWWWQSGREMAKEVKEKPSVTETTVATGKIIPPPGVSPETFEIVGLTETTTPDIQGDFSGKIYEEGVTVIGAMVKGKEFGLMKVVIASKGKPETSLILDSKSTAVGLIFTTPFFMTNDPQKARELLAIIENDPKVQALAEVIESVFITEEDFLDNPTYQQASKEAVESVLSTLNP